MKDPKSALTCLCLKEYPASNTVSTTVIRNAKVYSNLIEDAHWQSAVDAYADDHDDFFHRLRRAKKLNSTFHFSSEAAEARRGRAYALMAKHPEFNPDVSGLGPEARCNDHAENTLLEHTQ